MSTDPWEGRPLQLFTDGASRGNPGPSAWAYILLGPDREVIEQRAGVAGRGTNNEAEYRALIEGLHAAARHGGVLLSVCSDSELVIRQMNGRYRVASPRLLPLYREARSALESFKKVEFISVPRDHPVISRADRLCNEALDKAG